jgi:hypothetical protein
VAIGLSGNRSVIQWHDGRPWEVSRDGPGPTFTFSIPGQCDGTVDARAPGVTHAPAAATGVLPAMFL